MTKQSSSEPGNTGSIQSIRSSCDRCRFHKLKCSVPSENRGSTACERCTRAKVPCVFGRRRRANRSGDEKKRSAEASPQQYQPEDASTSMPSPPSTSASTSALGGDITPDRHQASQQSTAQPDSTCAPSSTYTARPWEGFIAGISDDADAISAQHGNGHAWEWLQHGFGFDENYILDTQSLDPALWSPPATMLPTLIAHNSEFPTMNDDYSKGSSCVPVQRILSLIADMQQRLKFLEQGPWQGNSSRSLDDYPVGTILHLSQEFGAVAGPVLRRASVTDNNTTSTPTSEKDLSDPTAGTVDTATVMLVLGGYMWLVRIYGVVLGHFQAHLSRISMVGNEMDRSVPGLAPNASLTLQLGELPSANTAPDLGRIHTALGMLLGALNEVEEQLGRGGAVARNLVVTLLTQEAQPNAGYVYYECDALSGKVQSVKELLREKMGF